MTHRTGVRAAVEAAGGYRSLGRALGIGHRAIGRWEEVPAHWLLTIEKEFKVPRHELRPDIFAGYVVFDAKTHRRAR